MKKILIFYGVVICVLCHATVTFAIEPTYDAKQGISYEYTPAEGSIEELYKDIIVTLVEPIIDNEVINHYGKPLQYDLFDIDFLKIERPLYRSFSFTIKLQIKPFVGAHNTIGIDEITIKISAGETKVEDFKHITSFPITPY